MDGTPHPEPSSDLALAALECPMAQPNDAEAPTIRAYLLALVRAVWTRGEGFSGKHPFGNSSWESEVYAALGRAGLIHATFDSDGGIEEADEAAGDALILAAIERLGTPGS